MQPQIIHIWLRVCISRWKLEGGGGMLRHKPSPFKVLSSEMYQAKSGLIRKLFIKGNGAEIFS